MVTRPLDLRAHARAAGAGRPPAVRGAPGTAHFKLDVPRAARRGGDGGAARRGSCRGCPEEIRAQVLARAEGVPLYAVETVRMLIDRGALVQEGDVYRPVGPIESLDIPETLHALIAARLDVARARGAPPAPGRVGARQDLQRRGTCGHLRASASRPRRSSSERSCARRSWDSSPTLARPSTGNSASSRTLSATSPTKRFRGTSARARHLAAAEYVEGAFTGDNEVAEVRRRPLPRRATMRRRTRTTRQRSKRRRVTRSFAPATGRTRSGRPARRCAT